MNISAIDFAFGELRNYGWGPVAALLDGRRTQRKHERIQVGRRGSRFLRPEDRWGLFQEVG